MHRCVSTVTVVTRTRTRRNVMLHYVAYLVFIINKYNTSVINTTFILCTIVYMSGRHVST